ncbi:unnamed protein product [Porites lobata]|uniref:Uncharacterized protein n=1 Tax=Porites lobata TaxID=104759 RepID=A0ABN8MV46_9CNID|nr:unnamed protein product [Porites lobata]
MSLRPATVALMMSVAIMPSRQSTVMYLLHLLHSVSASFNHLFSTPFTTSTPCSSPLILAPRLTWFVPRPLSYMAYLLPQLLRWPAKPMELPPMDVVGEVHCTLTRGQQAFELDALVVRQLDVDILAGNPFLARNDIGIRPARRQIVIGGSDVIHYGTASKHTTQPAVRRTQSFLLRNPQRTVILPGEYVQLDTPCDSDPDTLWALEPRLDCPSNTPLKAEGAWPPPQQVLSVDHAVRITNTTDSPILLRTGEQLCHVRHVIPVDSIDTTSAPTSTATTAPTCCQPFSTNVILDPDGCLDEDIRDKFRALNLEFDDVFNPTISKYNGASGTIEAVVNIGPTLPPQRKGRLPQYNRSTLEELQAKFDELEVAGVFAKPEQVNVHVEYLNTSFLVKKPNGGSRLVTSFGEVAQYSKPQPSLMPNVDGVLREIGKWEYIQNHMPSAKSKAHGFTKASIPTVLVGDLVFIKGDKDKLKARDKYLVIGIDQDLFCQLRKFTSSQFRSKVYTIPMCDCYPVTPTVLAQTPPGPIRGQTESTASDSDDDPVPVVPSLRPPTVLASPPVDTSTVPVHHSVSPAHSQLPAQEHPPIPEVIMPSRSPPQAPLDPSFTDDAQPTPAAVIPTRKSDRSRKAPFWHNKDWDFD